MERDHTLTSELVCFHWCESQGFKVSRLMGSVCVYVCVCVQGEGPLVCHDSSAWIKCGTLIWVKIMESYMSLGMSAFHSRPKWKVTAGRGWGGGQRCWNGNRGHREAIPVADPQSARAEAHCHQTSSCLTPPSSYFLSLFTCVYGINIAGKQIGVFMSFHYHKRFSFILQKKKKPWFLTWNVTK